MIGPLHIRYPRLWGLLRPIEVRAPERPNWVAGRAGKAAYPPGRPGTSFDLRHTWNFRSLPQIYAGIQLALQKDLQMCKVGCSQRIKILGSGRGAGTYRPGAHQTGVLVDISEGLGFNTPQGVPYNEDGDHGPVFTEASAGAHSRVGRVLPGQAMIIPSPNPKQALHPISLGFKKEGEAAHETNENVYEVI
ncbi:hypothetical protein Tco_0972182 [Tanacetum coccineum]